MISILDDGSGIEEQSASERQKERKSFGLKIINDRMQLLNINFPDSKSSFKVIQREHTTGSKAEFIIPRIPTKRQDESSYN